MKFIRYGKYVGEPADAVDLEELVKRLGDFFLQSGFESQFYGMNEMDPERSMEALRQAILKALQEGDLLPEGAGRLHQPAAASASDAATANQRARPSWATTRAAGGSAVRDYGQDDRLSGVQDAPGFAGVAREEQLWPARYAGSVHRHRGERNIVQRGAARRRQSSHRNHLPGLDGAPVRVSQLVRDGGAARLQSQYDSLWRGPIHTGKARGHGPVAPDSHAVSRRHAEPGAVPRQRGRSAAGRAGARAGGTVLHEHARRSAPGAADFAAAKERYAPDRDDHRWEAVRADARGRAHLQERLWIGSFCGRPNARRGEQVQAGGDFDQHVYAGERLQPGALRAENYGNVPGQSVFHYTLYSRAVPVDGLHVAQDATNSLAEIFSRAHLYSLQRSRLESICGNVAPNLALDGVEKFYDACQHRKYRARFFTEGIGREGLFPAHAAEKRPRGCRVFQDFVSGLPVHLSLLGAALQAIWRGQCDVSGYFSGRCAGYEGICARVWSDLPDGPGRKGLPGLKRVRAHQRADDLSDRHRRNGAGEFHGLQ